MIPVLVVLTLLVIFQSIGSPSDSQQAAAAPTEPQTSQRVAPDDGAAVAGSGAPKPVAAPATPFEVGAGTAASTASSAVAPGAVPDLTKAGANGHPAATFAAGALPAGAPFEKAGAGAWHVVPGTTPLHGTGPKHFTYTVEVENRLQDGQADEKFAATVDAALADPRSWTGGKQFALQRIDKGDPDFRVSLTSQMTVRAGCGFDIPLEASCFNRAAGRVFINDARWVRGAMSYEGDLDAYRAYAVNHEVGHALGMRHQPCPTAGAPAPVMMQQSWSVSNDDLNVLDPRTIPKNGKVCKPNPYPFPSTAAPNNAGTDPSAAAG